MTASEIQTLINAAKSSEADLVTWTELRAILEGLKNQEGAEGDYTLDMLGDVDIDGFLDDTQVLRWNGTAWVNEVLTTDDIAEGNNLFFTLSRSRNAISGGTGISYNPATGEIISTITQYTSAMARAAISLTTTGSGAATYNSSTGVLNIPTPSSVNLYNSDGTLTGNRMVTMGTNSLTFNSQAGNLILSTNTSSTYDFTLRTATFSTLALQNSVTGYSSGNGLALSVSSNVGAYLNVNNLALIISTTTNNNLTLGTNNTERMRIFANGKIGINTTTDAGFWADINGTLRVQNTTTITQTANLSSLVLDGTKTLTTNFQGGNPYFVINPTITDNNSGNNTWYRFLSVAPTITHSVNLYSQGNYMINVAPTYTTSNSTDVSDQSLINVAPVFNSQRNIGNTRGLFVNPTFNSITGDNQFTAIQTVRGNVLLATTSGNVGIGTSSPQYVLDVATPVSTSAAIRTTFTGGAATANISVIGKTVASADIWGGLEAVGGQETSVRLRSVTNHPVSFWISTVERGRIFTSGNWGINTTTDSNFRFDVNGTMRVSDNFTMAGNNLYSSGRIRISGTGGNNTWIETTGGGTFNLSTGNTAVAQLGVPTIAPTSGTNQHATILLSPGTVNATGSYSGFIHGIYVTNSTITSLASGAVAGVRIGTNLTTNVWALYVDGTANNYFNGNVGIGLTNPTRKLHVIGDASISDDFFAATSTGKRAVFGATGDADYRVSVDGDLRVYGKIRTGAPDGGSGPGIWKLGSSATGTFTLNTSQCLEVELNGTLYRIATLNLA